MWWNIDRISGSPRFPLKPVHYLLFKIKSNKFFSPPLNSTWIMLKLNRVESFLSFFIPITFPPTPIAEASPRVILWYVVLLQYCQAFWPTSILSGSITEAESWSPGLLPGIHICTTWSFWTEEGWRVAPRPRNLLWVHLSVQPIPFSSLCFQAVESWDCSQYVSVCSYARWQPSHLNLFPEYDRENRGLRSEWISNHDW